MNPGIVLGVVLITLGSVASYGNGRSQKQTPVHSQLPKIEHHLAEKLHHLPSREPQRLEWVVHL